MDLHDFDRSFGVGFSVSLEERAALETEMHKRQVEEKLASIKFWGKVTGTTTDYIVVCGLTSLMETPRKKFYFATAKSLKLQQMPEVTPEFAALSQRIKARFTGNPSQLLGPDASSADEEEEEEAAADEEEAGAAAEGGAGTGDDAGAATGGGKKPKRVKFSEAHRLAHAVATIEQECGVVPVGAFIVTPTHHIAADPLFCGLSATEAASLDRYAHFRASTHPARKAVLAKVAAVGAGDFLDPLAEDALASLVWSVRMEGGRSQATLRSLRWPGYFFWHDFGTPRFGGAYFGPGLPNDDLAFMA